MSLGAIVAAVVLLSIASPIAAVVLLARFSGWSTLAERYPGRTRPAKVRRRLGYGVFRGWIGYNGGLVVGSDAEGLDLRAMPVILSFCHPPIFIPWRELTRIETQARWFGTGYALVTRRAPEVDVALRPGTFEAVRVDAQGPSGRRLLTVAQAMTAAWALRDHRRNGGHHGQ